MQYDARYTGGSEVRFEKDLEQVSLIIGFKGVAYSDHDLYHHRVLSIIFGIYSSTNPGSVNELIDVVADQMKIAINNIEEKELVRAKAQVKAGILMAQESSSSRVERLSATYARFDKVIPINELVANIDAISLYDIQVALKNILTNHELPTFASIGRLEKVMPYDEVRRRFVL